MSCMALHTQKTIIIANGKKKKKKNDEIKGRSPVCIRVLSQRIHLSSFSVWAVFKGNGNLACEQALCLKG